MAISEDLLDSQARVCPSQYRFAFASQQVVQIGFNNDGLTTIDWTLTGISLEARH
jgi:hypothetical protein